MNNQHFGSCLCGEIRFRVTGNFEHFFLCHCSHCRKDSGSAHTANLFSTTAELEWISGRDKLRTYNLPGTRHTRCFCASCGSAMPCVSPKMIVVPAGCLDTDLDSQPDAHVFMASKASWDRDLADIPVFNAFPA